MEYVHYSVMAQEILQYLVPPADSEATMVDCTCGEGGHTHLFLSTYPMLKVIGLDRDATIQQKAIERMKEFSDRFIPRNIWFNDFFDQGEDQVYDLILFDLGISSFHYEESQRGFSFRKDEALDMRLDESASISAFDVVNGYQEERLADVIYNFGEERYSRRIARAIVERRKLTKIATSEELASIIYKAVPANYRYGHIHPATRSFQAIRIEVNRELDRIEPALRGAIKALKSKGRLAVISFHSLEDRQVKWLFKGMAEGDDPAIRILTKKPLVPTDQEREENAASRSAKLRIIEKR
ncbi:MULTISPECIES: 16S rRNA (cytosine(1402)-N(4))-methyltransferase RsmH [Sphaerochaeta]|jgi:16S rRNA (cytosine1402-N4)-methyltransferase|uniref:Ribosomal RNA small subunit methyltransferase H n=2 Tax=root TaxID=1 RepID=A0ABY4DEZ5_9SPIR|nr:MULTISPECIES: 16S rRNA (cytosine(1402)-N(4))-methyltransferase RsmH [Sphaerochaeta]NLA98474.1 16S rRNA (cytosine(1402)-N(4))-methyltransferase RsmH [Spirochaetales bacterium]MDD2394361.1 16S rRNA (cytosine(1402)-N(4))-methyltransferase RsmH [Sphaerochaeta sp.]MDD3423085.1 16S rRNA (cytosine(1402)-N(4))-methyltransferase RsmH [Sphaerochaeta sp.]MDD3456723.1 16S rRNA (cytosine(1402)-N(4))-methyltransferase RsmH [Sphaerochaeta sp.]MDD4037550.1 16S rRNA (cytosine(1402)-N(4))-methyltransferase R